MSNDYDYDEVDDDDESFSETLVKVGTIAATSFLTGLVWSIGNNVGSDLYEKMSGNNSRTGEPPQIG